MSPPVCVNANRKRGEAAPCYSSLREEDQQNLQNNGCSTTFHRWRNQYGGMKAEEAKRLKELEEENKRLKKLLAEAQLDKEILKEALEGNY